MTRRETLAAAAVAAPILATTSASASSLAAEGSITELRQYTTHPGARDRFIQLSEQAIMPAQEAVGIQVLGPFLDLDDPDRMVWFRRFADRPTRTRSLAAFAASEAWRIHRAAAAADVLDTENVLVLQGGAQTAKAPRSVPHTGLLVVHIHYIEAEALTRFAAFFDEVMTPPLTCLGIRPMARFTTHGAIAADDARPPARVMESAFIWLAAFTYAAAYDHDLAVSRYMPDWREAAGRDLVRAFDRKPEILRLAPTASARLLIEP